MYRESSLHHFKMTKLLIIAKTLLYSEQLGMGYVTIAWCKIEEEGAYSAISGSNK